MRGVRRRRLRRGALLPGGSAVGRGPHGRREDERRRVGERRRVAGASLEAVGERRDAERLDERLGKLLRALKSLVRAARRRPGPPRVEARRNVDGVLRRDRQRTHDDLHEELRERLAPERKHPREASKGDDGDRPEIAAVVDRPQPLRLLRAHIRWRPQHRAPSWCWPLRPGAPKSAARCRNPTPWRFRDRRRVRGRCCRVSNRDERSPERAPSTARGSRG